MRAIKHKEASVKMMKSVKQIVVVLMMLAVVPVGAFAQRGRDQDKRPPKEPVKVNEKPKDKPPPPKNDRPKGDKKKP